MIIIRFIGSDGEIHQGILPNGLADGRVDEAELIEGSVFDPFRPSGRVMSVKKLLAPVDPPNVIAIGLNYRDHAKESGMAVPPEPVIFFKVTTAVIGPNQPIILPREAPDEVDYEAELAIIIGKRAKEVPIDEVGDYVLGYTCANDVSARDCQLRRDKQWARAKSFDTFCPLGPWIVTTDELDPSDLAIRTILSGQVKQDSRTSQMVFSAPWLVSFLSRQFTLLPGTVIMTGTPPGVGMGRKPPQYMRSGDEVTVEIEGIGRLVNPIVQSG
jgi:2-keto-4-pentenoate hydratase/2-oxohepta-3-ene-1,7-dioic acid hydratase in catechol pathway